MFRLMFVLLAVTHLPVRTQVLSEIGVRAGYAWCTQRWDGYVIDYDWYEGFVAGLTVEQRMTHHVSLRGEVGLSRRGYEEWAEVMGEGESDYGNHFLFLSTSVTSQFHKTFESYRLFVHSGPKLDIECSRRIYLRRFELPEFRERSPRRLVLGYIAGVGVQVKNLFARSITIEARYAADITRQYRKADISNRVIEVSLGTSLWERK